MEEDCHNTVIEDISVSGFQKNGTDNVSTDLYTMHHSHIDSIFCYMLRKKMLRYFNFVVFVSQRTACVTKFFAVYIYI